MGRSKFPGKPSKHVHKKRVNVLPCAVLSDKGISTIQNNSIGISVAHNMQSCIEQVSEFNSQGTCLELCNDEQIINAVHLTPETVCTSLDEKLKIVCKMQNKLDENSEFTKILNHSVSHNLKCNSDILKPNSKMLKQANLVKKPLEINSPCNSCDSSTINEVFDKSNNKRVKRKSVHCNIKKKQGKSNHTSNVSANSGNCASLRQYENESTSMVGKFVLPSRSLHSSRVIKPNKKFLSSETLHNLNEIDCTKSCVRKILLDKISPQSKCIENNLANIEKQILCNINENITLESQVPNHEEVTEDNSKINRNNTSKKKCKKIHYEPPNKVQLSLKLNSRENNTRDMVVVDSLNNSDSSWSYGKLVLRKARLQLHTQTSEGSDGPFSNYSSSSNPPGTVTCGVCGAVRFYRFVKQARKFNIYSCESCRKFISKMIKRQTCTKNSSVPSLVCHKGQGMCHVPPIVRSQQWKLIRCAYKARCPACWLKMCLRSFQMPASLKSSLADMLPENMRLTLNQNNDVSPTKKINR